MPNSLLTLIEGDLQAAQQLLQLIEDEYQTLQARDLQRLQHLVECKTPLLQQLECNAQQLADALQQAGLSADRQGLAELAQREGNLLLVEQGEQLAAILEQCREANMRNGRIIRAGQTTTGRLLDILRGQDTPSLYNRYGSSTPGPRQRTLNQA